MAPESDCLRVVLVSPGDVAEERAAAERVIAEVNLGVARDRLVLWRWETDARPGLHPDGPQGLIDQLMEMASADLVVGMFWKRFGTPTYDADSGTEHELHQALTAWRHVGRPDVMVYFSDRPHTPSDEQEADQWTRVLRFKRELPAELLYWAYTMPADFQRLLREHLTRWLEQADTPSATARFPRRVRAAVGERMRFNLPVVAASFTSLEDELERLHRVLCGRIVRS